MLEVVIPGMRYGEGVINSDSAYCGSFCWISGTNADGKQVLSLPYSSVQCAKACYPVNKYYFEEFYNDTSDAVDKLTNGDTIIYYEGGEYITDRFVPSSFGLTAAYWAAVEGGISSAYGAKLYVPGSSTAISVTGLDKVYVSSGLGSEHKLYGSTVYARGGDAAFTGWVGFAVGVYYSDSSDAKLRVRIKPNTNSGHDTF